MKEKKKSENKKPQNRKRDWACVLFILLMSIVLCCIVWGKSNEKQALGRYAQREVVLPKGGGIYEKMFPLSDGGYALYAEGNSQVLVAEDGTVKMVNGLWRNSLNINVEYDCAVSMDGDMLLAYIPILSEEEYEEEKTSVSLSYVYVNTSGDKYTLEPYGEGFSEDMELSGMAFAPDGKLYIGYYSGQVFCMDTETGEMHFLFQAGGRISEFCFFDDSMIVLDESKAWLYDTVKNTLLEENAVLNEFVASHQADAQTSRQLGNKPIVLAVGGENENILYLGCRTGLYRYIWGGSLIEQMADGQLLSFADNSLALQSMQVLENEEFRVFFKSNHMVELYFDETLPIKPEHTLHVYSLEENERIRYAAQLFQKENPTVLVKYETGMDGDNAVSREDAQRKLNTELLAGDGPDLLVMDGLDVEQYAGKGVLRKLDDILAPYMEDKLVYENIVNSMRMTEEEAVYALPMTVWVPAWVSGREYLEGEKSLWDIVAALEKIREEHPENVLLAIRNEEDLMKKLIFTSLPAWTKEDGSLDTEKLEDFFQAAAQLWELNAEGMSEQNWQWIQEELKDYKETNLMSAECLRLGDMSDWSEHIWMQLGYIYSPYPTLCTLHMFRQSPDKDMELWWDNYNGQAQNVFIGKTITGICQNAKEPELAEEFLKLLLSDTLMDKWWLETGMSITRHAVEASLDMNNMEYADYLGESEKSKGYMYNEIVWPNEEEKEQFRNMMESLEVFYQPGSALEETALEVGIRVLQRELTPEEGAAEVSKKMAIEMAE